MCFNVFKVHRACIDFMLTRWAIEIIFPAGCLLMLAGLLITDNTTMLYSITQGWLYIVLCWMMLDRIIILIRIRKMIVLPWFVRFGLDCTVAMTPIFYFHHHPTLFIFEYFQNRRRIVRRKSIFHPNQLSITSPTSTTSQQCLEKKPPNCSKSWESNSDMPYHNVIDDQK